MTQFLAADTILSPSGTFLQRRALGENNHLVYAVTKVKEKLITAFAKNDIGSRLKTADL